MLTYTHPPELIFNFISKLRKGYEVVYGHREERQENIFKKTTYYLFYRFLAFLSEIDIQLDIEDSCLLDLRVVDAINRLPENSRFIRGLRTWVGFRQVGVSYNRPRRNAGRTKYSLNLITKAERDQQP